MILVVNKKEDELNDFVFKFRFLNPYFYIDYNYIFENHDNCSVWKVLENNNLVGMILRYYNSLQIIGNTNIDSNEISFFVDENNYSMISGPSEIIDLIKSNNYKKSIGSIMKYESSNIISNSDFILADENDYFEISKLICSDPNIGGHYDCEDLAIQLKNRALFDNCRNLVLKIDGKIISHCATYAECNYFAVIGGVITDMSFRGKGYAKSGILKLVNQLIIENKEPLLYVYDIDVRRMYESMGFVELTSCSKLEKR